MAAVTIHQETIVLAGNPNVGKSVFFNAFTGQYVNVSNFPGTTVDIPRGELSDGRILKDTPGVHGLSRMSEEEQVAEQAIMSADKIINVLSALSLERDLFLTQQLLDYEKPMIVVLNQWDEAQHRGIHIDLAQLAKHLGVPVFTTVAVTGEGMAVVQANIDQARLGNKTPDVPSPEDLALLEEHPVRRAQIYGLRRGYVNAIVAHVVRHGRQPGQRRSISDWCGYLLLNPVVGVLSGLLVLYALYQIIGIWVAGNLVDFTEKGLILKYVTPVLAGAVGTVFPVGSALYQVLAGEFGVLTMSVQYIFGVLFPLVLAFYIYISLLEDCGYLPRIAVLCDGLLNKIGLNGRAVIPIILGFGCVTMATVSTRVLTSQRERTIASTILAITIPCSAQIGVIVGLMAKAGGVKAWTVFCAVLFTILLVLGTALNKLLPGKSSGLILDLPPMRVPSVKNVGRKTWIRTQQFLKEASPLFMLGSLLVAILQVTGLLAHIQAGLAPITVWLLHLPAETASAFIMGMVRRDFGAAGLYFLAPRMTHAQLLTSLMVITLFVPCIASATVIWKERGIKETVTVLLGSWFLAFAVGALVARMLGVFPVLG